MLLDNSSLSLLEPNMNLKHLYIFEPALIKFLQILPVNTSWVSIHMYRKF